MYSYQSPYYETKPETKLASKMLVMVSEHECKNFMAAHSYHSDEILYGVNYLRKLAPDELELFIKRDGPLFKTLENNFSGGGYDFGLYIAGDLLEYHDLAKFSENFPQIKHLDKLCLSSRNLLGMNGEKMVDWISQYQLRELVLWNCSVDGATFARIIQLNSLRNFQFYGAPIEKARGACGSIPDAIEKRCHPLNMNIAIERSDYKDILDRLATAMTRSKVRIAKGEWIEELPNYFVRDSGLVEEVPHRFVGGKGNEEIDRDLANLTKKMGPVYNRNRQCRNRQWQRLVFLLMSLRATQDHIYRFGFLPLASDVMKYLYGSSVVASSTSVAAEPQVVATQQITRVSLSSQSQTNVPGLDPEPENAPGAAGTQPSSPSYGFGR